RQRSGRLSSESLRDWVSYVDHVAVYTVADERAPDTDSARDAQVREVTLGVDRRLWSATGAPQLPNRFTIDALDSRDAPRLEVGERYLAPLARVRCRASRPSSRSATGRSRCPRARRPSGSGAPGSA
ncbi:MAG: hypothetical protein ACRDLA_03390, partial [Thermoleophilaceae bacterium]